MNKEKTFEVFEEIAKLLQSVRNDDPEEYQFNFVAMSKLQIVINKNYSTDYELADIENFLIGFSKIIKQ